MKKLMAFAERMLLLATLFLCPATSKANMIINWTDPEEHIEADRLYDDAKEKLWEDFKKEMAKIEFNARLLHRPVPELLRIRVSQLFLEANNMVRLTLRPTKTKMSKREFDLLYLRKKIALLRDELDRIR